MIKNLEDYLFFRKFDRYKGALKTYKELREYMKRKLSLEDYLMWYTTDFKMILEEISYNIFK